MHLLHWIDLGLVKILEEDVDLVGLKQREGCILEMEMLVKIEEEGSMRVEPVFWGEASRGRLFDVSLAASAELDTVLEVEDLGRTWDEAW